MKRVFVLLAAVTLAAAWLPIYSQTKATDTPRDYSGRVFAERLKSISSTGEVIPLDCGTAPTKPPDDSVSACGEKAFHDHKPFFLGYFHRLAEDVDFAYGLAGDSNGDVFAVTYEPPGFPPVAPNRHTKVLDDNQTLVTKCIAPVMLEKTKSGMLTCTAPINEEESAAVARKKPIETTICAIVDNPSAFNNKLVQIHGYYNGSFEYSTFGDNCGSLWFGYGSGSAPPSLVAYVGGGTHPGSEDSEGRRILPIPVKLVRDAKFELLEKLMAEQDKADAKGRKDEEEKSIKFAYHCLGATLVGRIDAVSEEIHEFRKKQARQSDGLGFGHMGIYEAQFILQSVDDANLAVCGE